MATSRQEKTYNEIIEYYNYADLLVQNAEKADHQYANQEFDAVEKVVVTLEKCADKLTSQYIEYVKSGNAGNLAEIVEKATKIILQKSQECRENIKKLHEKTNPT